MDSTTRQASVFRNASFQFSVAFCAVLLLLCDINAVDTVKILIVWLIQVYAGAELVEKFFYRRPLSVIEKFGLGLPVGVVVSVAFDLLFIQTSISQFAWLIPLIIIIAASKFAGSISVSNAKIDGSDAVENIMWVSIGLLAVIGQEWFWPKPIALCFMIGLLALTRYSTELNAVARGKVLSYISFTVGIALLVLGLIVRPNSWWIEDSDFGFYEAFTVSLSNWGTSENLLATGTGLKYHWFVYEWSGLITKVANLSSWVMLSRGVIVLGGFSLVCLIWIILKQVALTKKSAKYSLLIVCFFDSIISWGTGFKIGFISSPSQMVGLIWLFAIIAVLLEQDRQKIYYPSILFAALFSGAMLSKVSHGTVALGGLLFLMLVEMIRERSVFVPRFNSAVIATVVTGFWFWHTYLGAENAHIRFLRFPTEIFGDLHSWSGKKLWSAAFILLVGLVGYQFFGLIVGLFQSRSRQTSFYLFVVGATISGLTGTLFIESLFGSQLYFLHSASSVMLILTAVLTIESMTLIKSESQPTWKLVLAVLVGVVTAVISWAIPSVNSGADFAIWLRVSESGFLFFPLLVSLILVMSDRCRNKIQRFLAFGLISLCGLGVGYSMTNWTMILKREFPSFDRNEEANLGSKDLNDAMEWVRKNTDKDEIFVSNNESFLLSAISHRRGLLQAEEHVRRHTVLDSQWSGELNRRREFVDRAFKSISKSDLDDFVNFGVSIIVVDKSLIDFHHQDLPFGLPVMFENESFIVMKIDRT